MKTVLFWVLVGAACVASEVIINNQCNVGRDAAIWGNSSEINVDPCPGGGEGEPCVLYRGSNATITIKFTPTIAPSRLKSTIAWANNGNDLTFRGMRPDACANYLACPVRANQETTFSATLSLGSSLPTNMYHLKVKLQELRGRKRVVACQLFSIRLTDPE